MGMIDPTLTPPRRASLPFLRGGNAKCLPLKKGEKKRGLRNLSGKVIEETFGYYRLVFIQSLDID